MIKSIRRLLICTACISISISTVSAQTAEDISNDALLSENQMEHEISSDFVVLSDTETVSDIQSDDGFLVSDNLLNDENFDELFDDIEDTDAIVTSPDNSQNEGTSTKRGIFLTGNLESRLGGYFYAYPGDIAPAATFDSLISFASNPTQYFGIKGSLLANFPTMEIGLYELYINYSLWDYVFVTAGKKEVKWGNARIFDTDILDDANGDSARHNANSKYNPENLLTDKLKNINDAKFTVMMSVPFWKFNLTGLVTYFDYHQVVNSDMDTSEWAKKIWGDFAYAAMLEANMSNVAFDIFFKSWADNHDEKLPPALGFDVNFQIQDIHFYLQYFTHFDINGNDIYLPKMKGTASIWWATREKYNLGFVLEYQIVLDWYGLEYDEVQRKDFDASKYLRQYLAFEGVWGRINGSQFTVAVKYFHDFDEQYGTIVPGLKIHDVLPNADLDFGVPVYYGSRFKIGLGLQLKLNVNF